MIENIIILCINGRDEDIPNVNQNIEKLNNFKSYVFHDGNLRNCINNYNFPVISLDRSIGILYARKYIVEQIPDEYNNYYAVWFDSDDDFYLEELLFALSDNSYKNYDINGEINSNYHWNRIIKVSVLK